MRNINAKRNMNYRDDDPILSIDGSDILPDDLVIFPDGSISMPDGTVIFPDGSIAVPPLEPSIPEEVPIIDCSIANSQFTIMGPENHKLNMNRVLFGTGNIKNITNFRKSFKQNIQLKREIQNYRDYYSNDNNLRTNYLPLQR